MKLQGTSAVVTGGASGLGLATAGALVARGAHVVLLDLPGSDGKARAEELGDAARFVPGDVLDDESVETAMSAAAESAPLRSVVHCAGRGQTLRVLNKDGTPGSREDFEGLIALNLTGTFNVLRFGAAEIARSEPAKGERGAIVLTASVAAWEGQIGQLPYAASKAGIVGMTLVAARDLAAKLIRVTSIAPGLFSTPLLNRHPKEVLDKIAATVPHPSRLGDPSEFGDLAVHILENPMLNGETIRLDGAIRMSPR